MLDVNRVQSGSADLQDRIALRALVDSYAHAVDRWLVELFASLFCPDGQLVVPHPAGGDHGVIVFDGRDGWSRAFSALAPCSATTHFVGNHLVSLDGNQATGETYCLAHELVEEDGTTSMLVRAIRYADAYVRSGDKWLFRSRELTIDWQDSRLVTRLGRGSR
ncbi:nuclear transport factor 2 family protein [Amycolatopsis japonica]|uniref:nuclear transport factor 2 family protein n=1 Tax=Amycolatopsis japonica TaxID=208439 RepID=UPI00366AA5A2